MSVSLEKIDMLMERANISYKEAKEALEKFDGDMVEALIYLESNQKTAKHTVSRHPREHREQRRQQRRTQNRDIFEDIKGFVQKLHKTSFIVSKKDRRLLDIPLTVAGIIILVTLPASLFLLILPYFFGYQIRILNADGSKFKFDEMAPKQETPVDEDRYE
ncbi:DUF4342 domain-containing protein [Fusibacter paucivorans]|uniref:DUF4342 domain-containing protein n=1 Tax=Fusibacter paucivorans TaxID=76009 RepID=A0ABS5PQ16_9FIRM|nr:DUF4342 domain-containing protein [Fusibacter paucivorans]MBS7527022.1 DUF4342 domain-containing protein [Fusibacter paucivorans]